MFPRSGVLTILVLVVGVLAAVSSVAAETPSTAQPGSQLDKGLRRYIYAAMPDGSQGSNYRGIIVLDIDKGCSYVKTIMTPAFKEARAGAGNGGTGEGARGIVGHTASKRLWYTFKGHPRGCAVIGCLDLEMDRPLWEIAIDKDEKEQGHRVGAGQAAITPDGKKLYVPPEWGVGQETTVLNAADGSILAIIPTGGNGCGNALMSPDGKNVYASGGAIKIDTATDQVVGKPASKGVRKGQTCLSSHYMMDGTGTKLFATCQGRGGRAATICDTETGAEIGTLDPPDAGPLAFFRQFPKNLCHEGSFTPDGQRFWAQSMAEGRPELDKEFFSFPQVVDNEGCGPIKWVTEWDISKTPGTLVKAIATRSPDHSHAHALVTREGDLLLTGNGYALDTATGKIKHTWKDAGGKWFQATKFMQVNFRNGQVDWVGQRHGTGWLYRVPALSEKAAGAGPVAAAAASK